MTDPDEIIGASLGNYRVTSKLGQGGMGAVYLAEHPVLGRKAAIKVLLPELSRQKEAVDRFFHEARTTAQLRHPAMVDVFDYGTLADGRAFLIMDFLEGECLEDRIRGAGSLPTAEALGIARQIALGVSVAHAEQIVHRDLKPDNIFLLPPVPGSRDERVKILDFGIAKLARRAGAPSMTQEGMVIGTPLYMSPEQCRGEAEVDHRADVYSLGCILFTMVAGRPPFVSESLLELIALHQHAAPPRLEEVGVPADPALEQLVGTMLAKAPAQRFSSMLQVAEALGQLLESAKAAPAGPSASAPGGLPERHATPQLRRTRTPMERPVQPAERGRSEALGEALGSIGPTTVTPFTAHENSTPVAAAARRATEARRQSRPVLVVLTAAAVIALGVAAVRLAGRAPATAPLVAPAASASAPPAAPLPAAEPPAVSPAPEPPKPALQPAAVDPEVAVDPPLPAPAAAAKRGRGARPRAPGGRSRAAGSPSAAAAVGAAETAPAALEREPGERPRGRPDTPAAPARPIYKGTQLEIDKKAPY